MTTIKDSISQAVDRLGDELEALSRQIHDHPELAYEEVKACGWLSDFLAKQGYKVERGVGGVETAFRATIETGEGPTIAILCEYDALPGIGHACGHNVIATSGAGAGAALAAVRGPAPQGPHPGDRHARRGGRRRQGEADQGRGLQGRGLRDDDPRLRPHDPAPGSPRDRARHLRVHRQGLARLRRSVGGRERPRRGDPDVQRGQHAAPAGAAGLPDPRHHHERRRGGQHHPRVRRGRLLRAGAAHRHDVGSLQARVGGRGGRGPGHRLHAQDHPARQRLRADEVEPRDARPLRGQHEGARASPRARRSPIAWAPPTSAT